MENRKSYNKIMAMITMIVVLVSLLAGCMGKSEHTEATYAGSEQMSVTYIDVGKGDCILIEKGSCVILIDTGYNDTVDIVADYLKAKGITAIDYLIITHYDKDHVGGAADIAESFELGQIYLPDYEGSSKYYTAFMEVIERKSLKSECVSENVKITLDDVILMIYASDVEYDADSGNEGNDNDVSLVITAEYKEDSYLFAGDLEKAGINAYLAYGHGTFDVVKMPHHGKYFGKLAEFIESCGMQIAVITDSIEDPCEDKTLELLTGIEIFRSSLNGMIVITGDGSGSYSVTVE